MTMDHRAILKMQLSQMLLFNDNPDEQRVLEEAIAALSAPTTVAQAMSCPEVAALVGFLQQGDSNYQGDFQSPNQPFMDELHERLVALEIATIGQDVVMQDNGKDNANADN
jgi:hypothetical protein